MGGAENGTPEWNAWRGSPRRNKGTRKGISLNHWCAGNAHAPVESMQADNISVCHDEKLKARAAHLVFLIMREYLLSQQSGLYTWFFYFFKNKYSS
jgi:hypothetical protein